MTVKTTTAISSAAETRRREMPASIALTILTGGIAAAIMGGPWPVGWCAVMAVLSAMGLLGPEQTFTHESIIGTTFRGRVVGETMVGETPAIVPEIQGEAYVTGEHTFLIEPEDPLRFGFRL